MSDDDQNTMLLQLTQAQQAMIESLRQQKTTAQQPHQLPRAPEPVAREEPQQPSPPPSSEEDPGFRT